MRDTDLLYWGMVVTMFLLIAAILTARELFEMYMERRNPEGQNKPPDLPRHRG